MIQTLIRNTYLLIVLSILAANHGLAQSKKELRIAQKVKTKLEISGDFFKDYKALGKFKLDSVSAKKNDKVIQIYFNQDVSYIPLRESIIESEASKIKDQLGRHFKNYQIELFCKNQAIESFVPNFFRKEIPVDSSHFTINTNKKTLLVRPHEPDFSAGLGAKHIALWHSHGMYYESSLDRWEWQRARLHSTVEDLFPMSYVLPYLSKMLENAGAITFIPRERDLQLKEIIVDNDLSTELSTMELNKAQFEFEKKMNMGFQWAPKYFNNDNPFQKGSYLLAKAKIYPERKDSNWIARYIPYIPENGSYALYISYGSNPTLVSPATYLIKSANGTDIIKVDQSIGAGTWIYLGHYDFQKGKNPNSGSVELISEDPASLYTLDAIKIGGGMGNIARRPLNSNVSDENIRSDDQTIESEVNANNDPEEIKWKVSEKPRYFEAARYWLQYAGMPDSLVYNLNKGQNDYRDDYQCRGEWVNYLKGTPHDWEIEGQKMGLGIPIDLSLAFHTDAGVMPDDSIVGTLAIFNTALPADTFPGGRSKMVNRELADIIQSQIVEDIQKFVTPKWNCRGLWDKEYSEAYRASVPTLLLELLSHQNLSDMRYGLDPRFRYLVSRAIYKGILKFFAFQENRDYVVQPLAVDHFKIERTGNKKIRLSWALVEDQLEKSSAPDYYEIYIREGSNAFRLLDKDCINTSFDYELPAFDKIYSFRIVAVNKGGKSFPSETLSVGLIANTEKEVLVVNGFDRIAGPSIINNPEFSGISFWEDQGVPDHSDFSTVGYPYDFDRNSPWLDDDSPGWGASHADLENRIIPGNTLDFTYDHGQAILSNGFSFISCSDESFVKFDALPDTSILFLDLFFGEEKTSPLFSDQPEEYKIFTPEMLDKLKELIDYRVPIFISGAYIGTDMIQQKDTAAINFSFNFLHYQWRTNHADRFGQVEGTDLSIDFKSGKWRFNTGYQPDYYTVEAPDGIEPRGNNAISILRYTGTKASAAIGSSGTNKMIIMGFPFESILSKTSRESFMAKVISFLGIKS